MLSSGEIAELVSATHVNGPPDADAGVDQTIIDSDDNGFESITLDGNHSYDPDGDIVKYEWDFDNDGTYDWESETTGIKTHDYQVGNYIATLKVTDNEDATDTDSVAITIWPSDAVSFVYDRAGSIVFDGSYFYQYDAFNRLVQVNENGTLSADPEASDFDSEGRVKSDSVDKIGDLVASYVYDGLGRLIQKENNAEITENYYYDGVRRIQEVIDDEVDREYIYGPDYVDEFIVQIDSDDKAFYMLQDANYNVMALVDETGDVVEQYQYDAYGTVAIVDTFSGGESLTNNVGHQGLFFERFDDPTDSKLLDPGAVGLYYNRNRWYSPTFGRFIQRDPYETAMPIFSFLAMNGDIMQLVNHMFSLQGHYGDGMNLYQYCGSNPVNLRDPSGTFSFLIGAIIVAGCTLIFGLGLYLGSLYANGKTPTWGGTVTATLQWAAAAALFGAGSVAATKTLSSGGIAYTPTLIRSLGPNLFAAALSMGWGTTAAPLVVLLGKVMIVFIIAVALFFLGFAIGYYSTEWGNRIDKL